MSENHKYIILGGAAFIWMLLMLFVVCLAGIYEPQARQRQSHNTFIFKHKPAAAMTDINTMMPTYRLIPNDVRGDASYCYSSSSSPSYADRYIKTENKSLYTASSRLGEGDGEYSGFYRGMLWYNSVFNQYERKDWLGR